MGASLKDAASILKTRLVRGSNTGPSDVRENPELVQEWLKSRRQQITSVVAAVAARARQTRSRIKISAAVFRNGPVDRDVVGQDLKLWCERGYLDFACPMDNFSLSVPFERAVAHSRRDDPQPST